MKSQYIIDKYNDKQYKLYFLNRNILSCKDMYHYQQQKNDKNLMDMKCNNLQYCYMLSKNNYNLLQHNQYLLVKFIDNHQYNCMFLLNFHKFLLVCNLNNLNWNCQNMLNIQHYKVDRFHLHRINLINTHVNLRLLKTIKGANLDA